MDPRHHAGALEDSRDLQPHYLFSIHCLLYSRMETGLAAGPDAYDEDVNVYLAHLLHSFVNPEYVEQSRRFLSKHDTDVLRRLSGSTDARLRYRIHRTPTDFLLVSVALFDQPPTAVGRTGVKPSEEAYVGRGRTYYHFSYRYTHQMHRRNAGVPEVLEKLSHGFDKYLRILSHMRGEPLDLMTRFAQGEVHHLERTADAHAQRELLRTKQDQLLEVYHSWREAPSPETEESLERIVSEIRAIDPAFRFELPRR